MADTRYNLDKFILDADKSFIQANIKELKNLATNVYIVPTKNELRLDLISYDLYGTTDLKWLLIYVNDIIDVSVVKFGYKLNYCNLQDLISILFKTAENL